MAFYESIFVIRQDILAAEVSKATENFTKLIEENGGKVTKQEYWGLRTLSYPVKKNHKGHYVMLRIDANNKAISEFERHCKINEDVIRYITFGCSKSDSTDSIMLQASCED